MIQLFVIWFHFVYWRTLKTVSDKAAGVKQPEA